ncbi:undecaprenyl/decaprenyl-phosphate alpha-N-acetylglucosaminyl 1-phosphate transferase [Patescibacteria group bacterium]|nr:undecaprenyl/decaprenyl-phosphate alpha-N-acetylglucosaminyl 1-phosphate transferase [Patescibacteria group bacterium]
MLGYTLVFLSALVLGLILIALFRSLALKTNFVSPQGITRLGGLGMWLAFSIVCILGGSIYGVLNKTGWGIILGSGLLVAFGIIDDYKKELSVPIKFLVQIVATVLLILFGIKTRIIYIGPYLNVLITFLWVLGITNAFNHLDIMDGLAGGVAAISSVTFFLIALFNANLSIAVASLALTAVTLSFLRYNLSSIKVYMGNSGSHFLGFALAAIAILISYAPLEKKIALVCPILVLGLPVYDTLFVMFIRARKGRSIFKKSDDHFALRLLAKGFSKSKALIFMYLFGLFFSLNGLIISRVSNQIGIIILFLVVAVCLTLGKKISQKAR